MASKKAPKPAKKGAKLSAKQVKATKKVSMAADIFLKLSAKP
jgi:hypothetical protein